MWDGGRLAIDGLCSLRIAVREMLLGDDCGSVQGEVLLGDDCGSAQGEAGLLRTVCVGASGPELLSLRITDLGLCISLWWRIT